MSYLVEESKRKYNEVNRFNKDNNEYLIISNFGESSVTSEPGILKKEYFRFFTPVKPSSHRKLCSRYDKSFDMYLDTLMDYPTIIQYKLEGINSDGWTKYNRLISLHVSRCSLDCWHCYVDECLRQSCEDCKFNGVIHKRKKEQQITEDWFTAKNIVEGFIEQRDYDKDNKIFSNVLRITGGEPFLVPNLLLEVLEEIKSRKLDKEIFVWTETNLIPLIVEDDKPLISDNLLINLSKYPNFCVHPCFHGLNKDNFKEITSKEVFDYSQLLNAFKRLVEAGIDVYPTFGSNVSNPEDIENFFENIDNINMLLPLQFCVIEENLEYKPIKKRQEMINNFTTDYEKVYDKRMVIEKWDNILMKKFNYHYGVLPRHLINSYSGNNIHKKINANKNILHLFHWPSSKQNQQKFLQMIAIPMGVKGSIRYDKKWVNDSFYYNWKTIKNSNNYRGLIWGLSIKQEKKDNDIDSNFDYAFPLRYIKVIDIKQDDDEFVIDFVADQFLPKINKIEDIKILEKYMNIKFDAGMNPVPAIEKSLVYLTEMDNKFKLQPMRKIEKPSLESIYLLLNDMRYQLTNTDKAKIIDYPIIRVNEIKGAKIKNYAYKLVIHKYYNVNLSYYQGLKNRDRTISINNKPYIDKYNTVDIPIKKDIKGKDNIEIIINPNNPDDPNYLDYRIEVESYTGLPLHKSRNIKGIIIVAIIVLIAYWISTKEIFSNSDALWAVLAPLLVLALDKIYDIFLMGDND